MAQVTIRDGALWQLRVFGGEQALGNATGIVGVGAGATSTAMARWAALLGFPDTGFVRDGGPGSDVRVDSFSPFEELRLCTQTLLAAEAVLRGSGALEGPVPLVADTAAGPVRVVRYDDEGPGHVELPGRGSPAHPPRGRLPGPDAGGPLVIDTGRPRVYGELSPEALEAVDLSPATVRAFCRDEGVSALCLLAPHPDGAVRLRVFTLSLDGAEDAATGGAAAGVLRYLDERDSVLVHQGHGGAQTRGELHVRRTDADGIAVGGRVLPVATGQLVQGATSSNCS